jgi:hypothetical protein
MHEGLVVFVRGNGRKRIEIQIPYPKRGRK